MAVIDTPRTRPPLWDHQANAIDRALELPAILLGIPMGGGKSRVAIEIADRTDATRVLVLCPKSVTGVWPRELRKHSGRPWRTWSGAVINQTTGRERKTATVAQRATALLQADTDAIRLRQPFLSAVNFEAGRSKDMAALLLGAAWDLVIVDESHRIKAPGGRDSKLIARICARTRNRGGRCLLLTGTPMPHSPLDVWGQYRAINPDILGTSYTAFRAKYGAPKIKFLYNDGTPAYLTTPTGQVIYDGVRKDREAELIERIAPYMFTVDADELDAMLGLEEPRDVHRETSLEPTAMRAYEALERDLIARVGDEGAVVTAANAMVLVTRLAQATSGYAVNADTGEHMPLGDMPEKARLLADLLADLPADEPLVVFARFHADLDWIEKAAVAAGRTYGELSGRRRDGLTTDSTMADVGVLGAQLKSGGVGIDLTRARYAAYYSLDFSLADHKQSRKRLHRPGQDGRVTYVYLTCKDTIDEAIVGALRRREEVVGAVLARLSPSKGS